jgi:hypothetical protein
MSSDSDLERLLRDQLDAPEHAPGFDDRLWSAIHKRDGSWVSEANAQDGPGPMPSARSDALVKQRPRTSRRLAILAAAALLALGAVIGAVLFLPGGPSSSGRGALGPADANAAQVAAWMASGLGAIDSLRGQFVVHSYQGPAAAWDGRVDFAMSANGDYRSDAVTIDGKGWQSAAHRQLAVYDTTKQEFREIVWQVDGRVSGVDLQNIDPMADPNGPLATLVTARLQTEFTPDELLDYASVVRSTLTDSYPPIRPRPITYLGRPAWRVATTSRVTHPLPASQRWNQAMRTVAVIDRATGLLLCYSATVATTARIPAVSHRDIRVPAHTVHNFDIFELRMTALQVDPQLDATTFELALPAVRSGTGTAQYGRIGRVVLALPEWRVASLQAAASALGQAVLVPKALPGGFRLAAIDVSSPGSPPGPPAASTLTAGGLIRTARWRRGTAYQATLIYRRGLQTASVRLVSQRRWSRSPLGLLHVVPPGLSPSGGKLVSLTAGALAGRQAIISFGFMEGGPGMLSASGAGLDVGIEGDLTSSELVAAANSLVRQRG